MPNWLVFNILAAGVLEASLAGEGFAWAVRFPATKTLAAAFVALLVLYRLGRAAFLNLSGSPLWRPANLLEPGEPPVGNRLAWPAPRDAAARVATPAARALTKSRRPAPRDRGAGPQGLVLAPVFGFLAAVPASILCVLLSIDAVGTIWAAWGFVLWICITVSIALKTRRLNEDA